MLKIRRNELDILFSEYVRKRAILRCGGCERCLTWKADYKQLQCSHFHSRRKQSTRHDELNGNGFCFGCHQYFGENRNEYEAWLKNHIGEREFDLLTARACQIGKPDKKLIEIYLKARIDELKEANNVDRLGH